MHVQPLIRRSFPSVFQQLWFLNHVGLNNCAYSFLDAIFLLFSFSMASSLLLLSMCRLHSNSFNHLHETSPTSTLRQGLQSSHIPRQSTCQAEGLLHLGKLQR